MHIEDDKNFIFDITLIVLPLLSIHCIKIHQRPTKGIKSKNSQHSISSNSKATLTNSIENWERFVRELFVMFLSQNSIIEKQKSIWLYFGVTELTITSFSSFIPKVKTCW